MNEEEFRLGFARAEKSLYLVALGYLHNTEDARDAVQEAAEAAFRSYKKLRDSRYFKTWLTRILMNKCRDFIRRRRFTEEFDDQSGVFDNIPYDEICIMDAVCRLEPEEARLVTLRFYGGMTYEETARAVRMPAATVKYRTRKALEKLKEMLKE